MLNWIWQMTRDTDEHLHSLVVDVPVVPATRLEGDVMYTTTNVGQIAVANEILCIGCIGITFWPFAAKCISFAIEPGTEFIHQFLRVTHIHSSTLVGCQLGSYTFKTAQSCNRHYFAVGM